MSDEKRDMVKEHDELARCVRALMREQGATKALRDKLREAERERDERDGYIHALREELEEAKRERESLRRATTDRCKAVEGEVNDPAATLSDQLHEIASMLTDRAQLVSLLRGTCDESEKAPLLEEIKALKSAVYTHRADAEYLKSALEEAKSEWRSLHWQLREANERAEKAIEENVGLRAALLLLRGERER